MDLIKSFVIKGFPHAVSPPMASSVFPIFRPIFNFFASSVAVLLMPVASAGTSKTLPVCKTFTVLETEPEVIVITASRLIESEFSVTLTSICLVPATPEAGDKVHQLSELIAFHCILLVMDRIVVELSLLHTISSFATTNSGKTTDSLLQEVGRITIKIISTKEKHLYKFFILSYCVIRLQTKTYSFFKINAKTLIQNKLAQ